MIILGIDPGIAVTGFGVIKIENDQPIMLEYGAVRTESEDKKPHRLALIHRELTDLINKYKPDAVAVELLFFNRNTKTALSVGEARGVVLLTAGQAGIELFEYTPLQVKECLTGYGRTGKNDVREIVQMELNLDKPPKPIDASDALAIALTHHLLMGIDEDFI
jgi:crossover junction endodeoxyribonuclease RuvC